MGEINPAMSVGFMLVFGIFVRVTGRFQLPYCFTFARVKRYAATMPGANSASAIVVTV